MISVIFDFWKTSCALSLLSYKLPLKRHVHGRPLMKIWKKTHWTGKKYLVYGKILHLLFCLFEFFFVSRNEFLHFWKKIYYLIRIQVITRLHLVWLNHSTDFPSFDSNPWTNLIFSSKSTSFTSFCLPPPHISDNIRRKDTRLYVVYQTYDCKNLICKTSSCQFEVCVIMIIISPANFLEKLRDIFNQKKNASSNYDRIQFLPPWLLDEINVRGAQPSEAM